MVEGGKALAAESPTHYTEIETLDSLTCTNIRVEARTETEEKFPTGAMNVDLMAINILCPCKAAIISEMVLFSSAVIGMCCY